MSRTILRATDEQLAELYNAAAGAQHAIGAIRQWHNVRMPHEREQMLTDLTTAGERLAAALELERVRPTPRRPTSTPRRPAPPVTVGQAARHCAELAAATPHPNAGRRTVPRTEPAEPARADTSKAIRGDDGFCYSCAAPIDPYTGECRCS